MRYYCTLFDRNYLAKGLAMYESLLRHSSEPFMLYMLAMDDETFTTLINYGCQTGLPNAAVWTLQGLEGTLLNVPVEELRASRTWQEFCWTMAAQLAEAVLNCQAVSSITYLDADLFFFSDPKCVHDEIGDRSIGIIPHRLIPGKRHLEVNGKFNVGWVSFKDTLAGRHCLNTWANQVRDRCDASTCGDQKYLDSWCDDYGAEVCVVGNIGANVAPWNVANWRVTEGPMVDGVPIVFYHYHELLKRDDGSFRLTNYELREEDQEFIYRPYLEAYAAAEARIADVQASGVSG